MEFRKKPVVIEATQWFKNGDHPQDDPTRGGTTPNGALWEGLVVRYFRHPDISGQKPCNKCGQLMHDHGWIDTLEGGHIVCPGDWIITGVQGERYPCKPDIFAKTYEPAEASPASAPEGKALWDSVYKTLRSYRMTMLVDSDGGGYPLIDAMSPEQGTVESGIEECTYLADAIYNDLLAETWRLK